MYSVQYSRKVLREKSFTDCSLVLPKDAMCLNFMEKTFMNSHKTSKLVKAFSLKASHVLIRWQNVPGLLCKFILQPTNAAGHLETNLWLLVSYPDPPFLSRRGVGMRLGCHMLIHTVNLEHVCS